ncbi:hypothetical protein D3C87_1222820 [compost metagenome]
MGKSRKIQRPQEQVVEQWWLPVPLDVAQQVLPHPDDTLEWIIVDENTVVLHRTPKSQSPVKKNPSSIICFF